MKDQIPERAECCCALLCHPASPTNVVREIEARVHYLDHGSLRINYLLRGDIARLRLPEDGRSGSADGLWEHTCFEAFIAVGNNPAYREFNFSPSGQWAAYAFLGYRQAGEALRCVDAPVIVTQHSEGSLRLAATIPASLLPAGNTLHIGLSAVVESADTLDGNLSYWALSHPATRPDFHHRDAFTLVLGSRDSAHDPLRP